MNVDIQICSISISIWWLYGGLLALIVFSKFWLDWMDRRDER